MPHRARFAWFRAANIEKELFAINFKIAGIREVTLTFLVLTNFRNDVTVKVSNKQ